MYANHPFHTPVAAVRRISLSYGQSRKLAVAASSSSGRLSTALSLLGAVPAGKVTGEEEAGGAAAAEH